MCPGNCKTEINQPEIRRILREEDFAKYLDRELKTLERNSNTYHCKTPNCTGFVFLDDNLHAKNFLCFVCKQKNCLRCNAVHTGMNCHKYRNRI